MIYGRFGDQILELFAVEMGSKKQFDDGFKESAEQHSDSVSTASKGAARKAKRRAAQRMADAIGMPDSAVADWLVDFDDFMPEADGLTAGEDLIELFERAFEGLKELRGGVIFSKGSGIDQDAVDNVSGYYRDSKAMQELAGSEPDLMLGMIAAERAGAAYLLKATEFSILRTLMQADLVRRRALAECWKHNLPKAMLAFFAVMDRAGFSSNDYRLSSGMFSRFLDFVVSETGEKVDRSALMQAAIQSEEQFTGYGSDELGRKLRAERTATEVAGDGRSETAPARISSRIAELNSRLDGKTGLDASMQNQRDLLVKAQQAGAGLDAGGRIIFESVEAFSNCVKGDAPSPTPKQARVDDVVAEEAKPPKQLIEPELAKLPVDLEAEVAKAKAIRSSGFGNCRTDKPFDAYRYSEGQSPFQFVPFRDAGPVKEPVSASIKLADFVRLEVCPSGYELEVVSDRSAILGRCHELMLPNEPEAAVYGRRAGWSMPEARELLAFGSASRPEKIGAGGDWEKLDKALVGVAGLQLKALANAQSSHLLADPAKASEAAEDLGRWWMFVLFVRLNPEKMMAMLPTGFLHGVHGPDVAIEDGRPVMGDSHIRIIDPVQERLELNMTDEEIVAEHGPRHVRRRLFDKV